MRRGRCVKSERRSGNLDNLCFLSEGKLDWQRIDIASGYLHFIYGASGETWSDNAHLVEAERNILEGKLTLSRRHRAVFHASCNLRCLHLGSRDYGSARVSDGAVNCPTKSL